MTRVSSEIIKRANDKVIQAYKSGQVLISNLPNEKTEKEIRDAFQIASSAVKLRNLG